MIILIFFCVSPENDCFWSCFLLSRYNLVCCFMKCFFLHKYLNIKFVFNTGKVFFTNNFTKYSYLNYPNISGKLFPIFSTYIFEDLTHATLYFSFPSQGIIPWWRIGLTAANIWWWWAAAAAAARWPFCM